MDIISYSIAKKAITLTEGLASGVKSVSVVGNKLHFVFLDGSVGDMAFDMAQGVSISGVSVNKDKHLICTLSDGNTIDAGEIPTEKGDKGEQGEQGEQGVGISDIEKVSSVGNTDIYEIKCSDGSSYQFTVNNGKSITKVSELDNDLNFITTVADNLVNYYTKTDTYNKDEINDLLSTIKAGLKVEIVKELPVSNISTQTIYLVKIEEGLYNQYMYISSKWAMLGTNSIDLSNYYSIGQVDSLLNNYVSSLTFLNELSLYVKRDELSKVATTNSYNDLDDLPVVLSPDKFYEKTIIDEKLEGKVDKITGKSLVSDTEIERLASVENYDDTKVKEDISDIQELIPTSTSPENQLTDKAYVDSGLNSKVDKADGMGLSSNDYTNAEKDKLAALTNYDDSTVNSAITDLKTNKADKSDTYTKTETDSQITLKVSEIVADAPKDFDTLKEMSDWIANHKNDATAMNSAIQTNTSNISNLQAGKVDKETGKSLVSDSEIARLSTLENYDDTAVKADISSLQSSKVDSVEGKGLSSNDYTTTEKEKLASLENYTLPTASADTLGGVKIGEGLSITDGVLSASGGNITYGTEDLTEGVSLLADGTIYFVYEL